MTLVLYRIDDRLIHGQVVVGWGQAMDIEFIVLVDDAVAGSEWEQELYRMGVPAEMEVVFHTVADATHRLDGYRRDRRRGILLTGDVRSMACLAAAGGIPAVNVGGVHHRPGRVQRLRYVFLNADEERQLREIASRGVEVAAQDVPAAWPVPLDELLRSEGDA
ncbi:MAG: PTS system mannose/fructose/N-acetylgalactosamine-transporter subunit IIB [Gemmatimonadaceae bacterium]